VSDLLLNTQELRAASRALGDLLARYQEGLSSRPVFPDLDSAVIRRILVEPFPDEGRPPEELFAEFERVVAGGQAGTTRSQRDRLYIPEAGSLAKSLPGPTQR
jgi:hypothetical protein